MYLSYIRTFERTDISMKPLGHAIVEILPSSKSERQNLKSRRKKRRARNDNIKSFVGRYCQ
jgi:hypothetical protein